MLPAFCTSRQKIGSPVDAFRIAQGGTIIWTHHRSLRPLWGAPINQAPSELTELKNKMRSFFSIRRTFVTRLTVSTKSQQTKLDRQVDTLHQELECQVLIKRASLTCTEWNANNCKSLSLIQEKKGLALLNSREKGLALTQLTWMGSEVQKPRLLIVHPPLRVKCWMQHDAWEKANCSWTYEIHRKQCQKIYSKIQKSL